MELIIAITIISIVVVIFNMLGRIKQLESILQQKQLNITNNDIKGDTDSDVFVRDTDDTSSKDVVDTAPKELDLSTQFISWLKQDWLMKLGAFLMILAIGWFVQYAISNNWINELTRILLGLALGLSFMVGGYLRSSVSKAQGGVLLALGSAMILIVLFIARAVYDMFDPAVVLTAIFALMTTTTFIAVKFSNKSLATVAIFFASLAPLLAVFGNLSFYTTFAYLMVLALGSIWVVYITQWRELVFENLLIVFLYSIPFWLGTYDGVLALNELMVMYTFAGVFFVSSLVGILRKESPIARQSDLLTGFGTGGLIFAWTLLAAPTDLQTFMLVLWALVFAIGSYTAYIGTKQLTPFALYGGVAMVLLGFAASLELDNAMLLVAFSVEIAVASTVAIIITHRRLAGSRVAALFILPVLMSIQYLMSSQWSDGIFFDGALALYAFAFILIATAIAIIRLAPLPEDSQPDTVTMPMVLLIASVGYLFMFIWLISHSLSTEPLATGIALLIYTIIGISAYFSNLGKYTHALHIFGQLVLAGVVARLLLVEVWSLDISGRIVVFALVGIALISTAFASRNK